MGIKFIPSQIIYSNIVLAASFTPVESGPTSMIGLSCENLGTTKPQFVILVHRVVKASNLKILRALQLVYNNRVFYLWRGEGEDYS